MEIPNMHRSAQRGVRMCAACIMGFSLTCAASAQSPAAPGSQAPSSASVATQAQAPAESVTAPDTVLIRSAAATLTRGDYDLELTRLPADARGGFGTNPSRVNGLLNRMLVTKTMAAGARNAGIDKDPEAQKKIAAETERVLAALYIEKIDREAGAAFDARPGIESAARERYIVDADKFRTPEMVTVTHILFEVSKHGPDEALKLAQEARAKVMAGANMNALAEEVSEDPSAKRNGGTLPAISRDQMDPAFSAAAFALKSPGDVSEPVLSRYGYHIIRLDSRIPGALRPYAEVRPQIIAEMRNKYIDEKRNERINAVRNDPTIVVNEPAVEALVVRVDQEKFTEMLNKAATMMPLAQPGASVGTNPGGAKSPSPK
jgi:peptidyl-prolyl cis-trans isomerase C